MYYCQLIVIPASTVVTVSRLTVSGHDGLVLSVTDTVVTDTVVTHCQCMHVNNTTHACEPFC